MIRRAAVGVPLFVAVLAIGVQVAVQLDRDKGFGLPLWFRVAVPVFVFGCASIIFVGYLGRNTRRARRRIPQLHAARPGALLYSVANTIDLREAIRVAPDAGEAVRLLSAYPTLMVDVDGLSVWGDELPDGAPVRVWNASWAEIGEPTDIEFHQGGFYHRAIAVALNPSGELPLVLCREDRGGFSVGRKRTAEFSSLILSEGGRRSATEQGPSTEVESETGH